MQEVCGTSDFEIGWRYVMQVEIVSDDRSRHQHSLREGRHRQGMDEAAIGEAAARRAPVDAQALFRKEGADRERRLESLAIDLLTALAERDALVRDGERRAGQALLMIDKEGFRHLRWSTGAAAGA
jgi:hypothetical protein